MPQTPDRDLVIDQRELHHIGVLKDLGKMNSLSLKMDSFSVQVLNNIKMDIKLRAEYLDSHFLK